jgi:hypothetical protein
MCIGAVIYSVVEASPDPKTQDQMIAIVAKQLISQFSNARHVLKHGSALN